MYNKNNIFLFIVLLYVSTVTGGEAIDHATYQMMLTAEQDQLIHEIDIFKNISEKLIEQKKELIEENSELRKTLGITLQENIKKLGNKEKTLPQMNYSDSTKIMLNKLICHIQSEGNHLLQDLEKPESLDLQKTIDTWNDLNDLASVVEELNTVNESTILDHLKEFGFLPKKQPSGKEL
jgi:hypothetical protein